MSDEEGWENVYLDESSIKIDIKERIKKQDLKINLLNSLIRIFKEMRRVCEIPVINEFLDLNIINNLYHLINEDKSEYEYYFSDYKKGIRYFKALKAYKVRSRIYFIINKKIEAFIEIFANGIIIKNSNKYKGYVFYIDTYNNIDDYTWYYSGELSYYDIFREVFGVFKKHFSEKSLVEDKASLPECNTKQEEYKEDTLYQRYNTVYNTNINDSTLTQCNTIMTECSLDDTINLPAHKQVFKELDSQRVSEVPSSYYKFRHHPKYCLESLLKYNQIISDKTSIQGYFKGEPIFLREHIRDIKSEKYFYKKGKKPKSTLENEPSKYKLINGVKYFTEDQAEDIVTEDMNDMPTQDYFHRNHIPVNSVYVRNEFEEVICKKLDIKYRKCFIGFNKGMPVFKGVFIYKKDLFVFSNFLFEYYDYVKKKEAVRRVKDVIGKCERIRRMCKKYKKLKDELK